MAAFSKEQMAKAKDGLCLATELTRSEVCVGAYLLKRINKKTGQCNPSIDRIEKDLGYSRSTVIRAENGLVNKGYFTKKLFGSRASTNQYNPCWNKLAEITSAIEEKIFGNKKPDADNATDAPMKPKGSQECDMGSARSETQTLIRELQKKTLLKRDAHSRTKEGDSAEINDNPYTNGRPGNPAPTLNPAATLNPSRQTTSRREIALEKAKKRIDNEIRENHPDFYVNRYVNLPDETLARAYEMEISSKRSGVPYLLYSKDT